MTTFKFQFLFLLIVVFKCIESEGELKTLNETTWSDMLEGEWMVEFFAPWCPACQQLQPVWEDFAKWSDDLGIKIGSIDVTVNAGLSGRFMITALPTILHVKNGVFRQYRGARDKDSFISFVEEKKWQSIEPVSSWKSPQSLQMSAVAFFFKLSMQLRSLHTEFVENYGIPYWGSYFLFGLATILFGTVLGLVIVCILDFFCRLKDVSVPVAANPNFDDHKTDEKTEEEYEGEDIIKDDVREDSGLRRRTDPAK